MFANYIKQSNQLKQELVIYSKNNPQRRQLNALDYDIQFDNNYLKKLSLVLLQDIQRDNLRSLCDNCREISNKCTLCSYLSSDLSILEKTNYEKIKNSMSLKETSKSGIYRIYCQYILQKPFSILYPPHLSNSAVALKNSQALHKRLALQNKLSQFNDGIKQWIIKDYVSIMADRQLKNTAHMPVCFSFLNFNFKKDSSKMRIVQNESTLVHSNGSQNRNSLSTPDLLNNPIPICLAFHTFSWVSTCDIQDCYKNLFLELESANLRRFWWVDPDNPDKWVQFLSSRLNFGSSTSPLFVEIALRYFVSSFSKNPSAQQTLSHLRFADDSILVGDTFQDLSDAIQDFFKSLTHCSFKIKKFYANNCEALQPSQNPTLVDKITLKKAKNIPKITPQLLKDTNNLESTSFLGINWLYLQDLYRPKILFNLSDKKRGQLTAENLTEESLKTLKVTKKLIARSIGIFFGYLGVDFYPIVSNLKIFFHLACKLTQKWDQDITKLDANLVKDYKIYLKGLLNIEHRLNFVPRKAIPEGFSPIRIAICVDSGVYSLSALLYLISKGKKGTNSMILLAKSKISHHSVIKNEVLAYRLGCSLLKQFMNSTQHLSKHKMDIIFGTDSLSSTAHFNPNKNLKCVLVRNTINLINNTITELFVRHKNITTITFFHLSGKLNPSNIGSKVQNNPIEIINSAHFREGIKDFQTVSYPNKDQTFMIYFPDKDPTFTPINKFVKNKTEIYFHNLKTNTDPFWRYNSTCKQNQNCNLGHGGVIKCYNCHVISTAINFINDTGHKNVSCRKIASCDCQSCDNRPQTAFQIFKLVPDRNIPDQNLISNPNILDRSIYLKLINNSGTLTKAINTLARVYHFSMFKKFEQNYNSKLDPVLQKRAFNSIILSSQAHFKVENNTKYSIEPNSFNIKCFIKRFSLENQPQYETKSQIPIISFKDTQLSRLLISKAHLKHLNSLPHVTHCGYMLTKSRLMQGEHATYIQRSTSKIKQFIKKCSICCKAKAKFFNTSPSNLRFLNILDRQTAPFSFLSIDIIGFFKIKSFKGSRRNVKCFILFIYCLLTRAVECIILEDYSRNSVEMALTKLMAKYSKIELILCDSGRQFIDIHKSPIFTHKPELIMAPQNSQMLNNSESAYKTFKYLLKTTFENSNDLVYPTLTYIQLDTILAVCCNLYNQRPFPGLFSTDSNVHFSPNHLIKTFLSTEQISDIFKDTLLDLETGISTLTDIISDNQQFKQLLLNQIKILLSSNNLYYLRKESNFIEPTINDICLLSKQADNEFRICQIISLNQNKTFAKIRVRVNCSNSETDIHINKLILIHRPHCNEATQN